MTTCVHIRPPSKFKPQAISYVNNLILTAPNSNHYPHFNYGVVFPGAINRLTCAKRVSCSSV